MIIVHSENSTAQPEWHPNAVQRGTWAIYQTCIVTIILCVWTTIHLNVPRPGDKSSRQTWRKIGWSLLTIIAPEVVALNAWLQYRQAKLLLADVNRNRPPKEPYYRHCLNAIAFAFFAPVRLLDWLRISSFGRFLVRKGLVCDRSLSDCDDEHEYAKDSHLRREARIQAQVEDANLTWTMSMAFYALSGGCIYTNRTGEQRVLRRDAIAYLAAHEPRSLLQLQRVVLQNPGKANAIGKTITCVQAMWFCAQCIARLSGSLAVSLLELNTFAHCVSTLLIYIFWWDKPYDVEVHTYVVGNSLDFSFLLEPQDLDTIWKVPTIYAASDAVSQDVVAYISDSNGNRLVSTKMEVYHIDIAPSIPRIDLGSKIKIRDTDLYISFEGSASILHWLYESPDDERFWRTVYSAWVESGRPLPPEPITQTERWFYGRTAGSPDLNADFVDQIMMGQLRPKISMIMAFTFMVYGGLHLLAWQYNFKSRSERYLWRISAVITASTGLLLLVFHVAVILDESAYFFRTSPMIDFFGIFQIARNRMRIYLWLHFGFRWLSILLIFFDIASRAFLVIESFIALPNSPRSTYTIPSWTAYIPHI